MRASGVSQPAFSVRRLRAEDLEADQAIRLRRLREEPQAFGAIARRVLVETPAARRLYEALGFGAAGRRIEAVRLEDRFDGGLLMRRAVAAAGGGPAPRP